MAAVTFDGGNDGKEFESRVLQINMAHFKNMKSSDRHGMTEREWEQLDRTLLHELTHGLMASNVNYFNDLSGFLAEGGSADLIHGVDDERYNEIIKCAKDSSIFKRILNPTVVYDDYDIYDFCLR